MVLDYNRIFKDIKEFLIYTGVNNESLLKEEFKKKGIYQGENSDQWPGNVGFNYIFILGRNLKGTVRLMIEQGNNSKIPEISESLETILNLGDLEKLSKISVPKLNIAFNKDNGKLEIEYHANGRTNGLYLSSL